jgi:hypothetical protein
MSRDDIGWGNRSGARAFGVDDAGLFTGPRRLVHPVRAVVSPGPEAGLQSFAVAPANVLLRILVAQPFDAFTEAPAMQAGRRARLLTIGEPPEA